MSSRQDNKNSRDDFEERMNREQLLNIYKSFENDDFDIEHKTKKEKKQKSEKNKNYSKSDKETKADLKSFENEVKPKAEEFADLEEKNLPPKKHEKRPKAAPKAEIHSGIPSTVDIDDEDEGVPKTLVITKDPPAIKVYAILAVAICFLFLGGLIYKNISDKSTLNSAVTSSIPADKNKDVSSNSNSNSGYIDYQAKMSEVKEPDSIRIVNESRPIGKNDVPSLVKVSCMPTVGTVQLEKNAHDALGLMYNSMKQDGIDEELRVYSGFRSYAYQNTQYKAFAKSIKKNMGVKDANACEAIAKQLFAKAGTSEHQLGTSVDLCIGKELNQNFLSTDAGGWLLKNAYKYGFVFRYSADKADIHKRTAEPWHLRYVGVTAAGKMYNENLSLEEYLGITG